MSLISQSLASSVAAVSNVAAVSSAAVSSVASALSSSSSSSADGSMDNPPVREEASVTVTVSGTALTSTELETIAEVMVKQDVEAPSSFSLRIEGDDALTQADSSTFALGAPVTVSFGYGTKLTQVFAGEITGFELEMSGGDLACFIVRGYDLRHRLLRGTRTDAYAQAADSDIASKIAQRNGLGFGGETTSITYELVLQHEQTDLDFLTQRAARIGYEVAADTKNLYFRPHVLSGTALALSMDDDVIEFYARMSAVAQPSEVHVRGWDPTQKAAIDQSATTSNITNLGGTAAPDAAKKAFSTVTGVVTQVDQPVFSAAEATAMAAGQLGDMALGFIRGEGTSVGNAGLGAGMTVALSSVGERFGGTYYVVSTEHTYTRAQGYRTRFMVRRNATSLSSTSTAAPQA